MTHEVFEAWGEEITLIAISAATQDELFRTIASVVEGDGGFVHDVRVYSFCSDDDVDSDTPWRADIFIGG